MTFWNKDFVKIRRFYFSPAVIFKLAAILKNKVNKNISEGERILYERNSIFHQQLFFEMAAMLVTILKNKVCSGISGDERILFPHGVRLWVHRELGETMFRCACLFVCLYVRELLPQFSFFLHQTWHTKLLCIGLENGGLGFSKKSLFFKLFLKWPLAKN